MNRLFPLIAVPFCFVACSKAPVACIDLSDTSIAAGKPVTFTTCSENALSYEWFIEGPEGAEENNQGWSDPQFENTFEVPGTYIITHHAYYDFSFTGEKATVTESLVVTG